MNKDEEIEVRIADLLNRVEDFMLDCEMCRYSKKDIVLFGDVQAMLSELEQTDGQLQKMVNS